MSVGFTSSSELFDRFQMIHIDNSYELIRFFENHEENFCWMPIEKQFIILCYYANALYATNQFEKYIYYAKEILQKSILENLQYVDKVDVYLHSLKQMTTSYLCLKEYDQAILIARQLVALDPYQKSYKALLKQALLCKQPLWVRQGFAIGIWALISWTMIELVKIMYWGIPYAVYTSSFIIMQAGAITLAICSLAISWQGHQKYVSAQVKKVTRNARNKHKFRA